VLAKDPAHVWPVVGTFDIQEGSVSGPRANAKTGQKPLRQKAKGAKTEMNIPTAFTKGSNAMSDDIQPFNRQHQSNSRSNMLRSCFSPWVQLHALSGSAGKKKFDGPPRTFAKSQTHPPTTRLFFLDIFF
jgi:hypothetical protein